MDFKSEISNELRKPLPIESVEFRVQSVSTSGWVTLLAYKDARVDMLRLDQVVGALNWKREHSRENQNCTVSIWDEKNKHWVSKEDTGTASFSEKEKGLASDSFKRACFNLGIGAELYDYPRIFFQLYPNEFKVAKDPKSQKDKATTTWDFALHKWTWEMKNTKGIIDLIGKDQNGRVRYNSKMEFNSIPKADAKVETKTQPEKQEQKASTKPKLIKAGYEKALKSTSIDPLTKSLTAYSLTQEQIKGITARIEELRK